MDPLISVIYVNYNTSQFLINSLKSLQEHCSGLFYEIIIVDNSSNGLQKSFLTDWLRLSLFENIKLILSDTNSGFAAANNSAAAIARGKYLFFLNPDTVLLNDVLEIFYRFMEGSNETTAACGGNLLNEDLSPNSSYGNFPGVLLEFCNVGMGLSFLLGRYFRDHVDIGSKVYTQVPRKVDYIVGADVFIKSDLFREMQGFDTAFFMYYEETDLFRRLAEKGYQAQLLPAARIMHLEGAALNREGDHDFNYGKFKMTLDSKLHYYRKWFKQSFSLIAFLIQMQIYVQYFKGRWGRDLKRLLKIYKHSLKASKEVNRL